MNEGFNQELDEVHVWLGRFDISDQIGTYYVIIIGWLLHKCPLALKRVMNVPNSYGLS